MPYTLIYRYTSYATSLTLVIVVFFLFFLLLLFFGRGKPRIISLYTELTSLKMSEDECVTDYMIRAETAANSLKTAGETISDSLLITTNDLWHCRLGGLPPSLYPPPPFTLPPLSPTPCLAVVGVL